VQLVRERTQGCHPIKVLIPRPVVCPQKPRYAPDDDLLTSHSPQHEHGHVILRSDNYAQVGASTTLYAPFSIFNSAIGRSEKRVRPLMRNARCLAWPGLALAWGALALSLQILCAAKRNYVSGAARDPIPPRRPTSRRVLLPHLRLRVNLSEWLYLAPGQ